MRLNTTLTISAFAIAASAANAQFTANNAGPINSYGQAGDPLNGQFSQTYTGPSTIFTSLAFSATLTNIAGVTWESDSIWGISGTGVGPGYDLQMSGNGFYDAPVNVSASSNGLFWFQGGSNVNFNAFQDSSVPSGTQAQWSDISFNWTGGTVHSADLGSFFLPSSLTFDTNGTTGVTDTQIALYTASGTLVASDDDSGIDLLSSITATGLAQDKYILVVGSYSSLFLDGMALPGYDSLAYGAYNLNLNGTSVATGSLAAGEFKTYSFEVVPEPGTMAVVGLGIAALIRRRRK